MTSASTHAAWTWAILVAGVVFTSASAILIRWTDAAPILTAFWRMVFAAALAWPIAAARRTASARRLVQTVPPVLSVRVVAAVIVSGLFLAAHFASWITAVTLTSVAHATVLVTMHPILVMGLAWIVERRRPSRRRWIATSVAVAGAVLLTRSGAVAGREPSAVGNLLAFVGAATFAAYLTIGSRVRRTVGSAVYSAAVYSVAAAGLLIPALAIREPLASPGAFDFVIFVALALVCTIMGHSVFNWALARIDARDVSATILLEPLVASLAAIPLFGEIPAPGTVIGGLVVIAALLVVVTEGRNREARVAG